ncbi:hypothetical protein BGY98DRAFT_243784 [Russula aff. rugulosa BPL654]|nr:hypothetical protein BGY98DRAFT_243784 [Russula aff. rugulosa BPL654]
MPSCLLGDKLLLFFSTSLESSKPAEPAISLVEGLHPLTTGPSVQTDMIIATHYTSPPDICYTGNREKKPTIWKQQQKWRRDYHHFVARSPPTLASSRLLYVREVHWLYESRIKGALECVLSSPTYYLHRLKNCHSFSDPFFSSLPVLEVLRYHFNPSYPQHIPRRCAPFLSRFCFPWCLWLLPSAREDTISEIRTPEVLGASLRLA